MALPEHIVSIEHCLSCLASFSRSYHTFTAINKNIRLLDDPSMGLYVFKHICNTLISDAAISWCKVFGSNSEEMHWKKFVTDKKEFKKQLLDSLSISSEDFTAYWTDMSAFRNKVIAHVDINHFYNSSTPSMLIALKSVVFTHKYIRESVAEIEYTGPSCIDEYGIQCAKEVLKKLFLQNGNY